MVRERCFRELREGLDGELSSHDAVLGVVFDALEHFWKLGFTVGAGLASGGTPEDFETTSEGGDPLVAQLKKSLIH